jgi:hypothetical protein
LQITPPGGVFPGECSSANYVVARQRFGIVSIPLRPTRPRALRPEPDLEQKLNRHETDDGNQAYKRFNPLCC